MTSISLADLNDMVRDFEPTELHVAGYYKNPVSMNKLLLNTLPFVSSLQTK